MDEQVTEVTAEEAMPTGPFVAVKTADERQTVYVNVGDVIRVTPLYAAADVKSNLRTMNGAAALPVAGKCFVVTHRDALPVDEPVEVIVRRLNLAWTISNAETYRRALDDSALVRKIAQALVIGVLKPDLRHNQYDALDGLF